MDIKAKAPWKDHTDGVPFTLDYFQGSMSDAVEIQAKERPNNIAFDFMGTRTTYKDFYKNICACAKSLRTIGIRPDDTVTIAMPNCPQAMYMFYAVNMIGAISNMVHPLSSEKELEFYINEAESVLVVTLDQFYHKIEAIRHNTPIVNVIIARIKDELSKPVRAGYMLTEGRKIEKIPDDAPVIMWDRFMSIGRACSWNYKVKRGYDDPAAILYSGGTTGTTKGIVLTNGNFNALGAQITATNPMFRPGDKMLAAMPIFHGFGLGVCIHSMMFNGGRCVLVPRFTPKSYGKIMTRNKCNFIAGVPTLYEALLRLPNMDKADLSSLKGVFSGGDSLSIELKKKLDKFLYDHKANVQVREGYGTTETVTACCLTPPHLHKVGSIGVPFPDTYIKIVEPGTDKELPYGTEGEILLAGPTVMKEYLKHPEETANTLRVHADGLTWVYTGDLGYMDEEGFVFFKGRAKRMIVTSGYNVYPAQLENIFDASDLVSMSCVIGVHDDYKMQRVKVFIVPAMGVEPNEATKEAILKYASKYIAKYAMPKELEFRTELPKTLVGKVAYRILEEEEASKGKPESEKKTEKIRQTLHFESLESTNTYAKEEDLPDGSIVVADCQTSGRGRMGHSFHSPKGGIYFSYVIRGLSVDEGSKLTVKAAVCVCKALEKRGFVPKIKPVNDIFVDGLKVCGILCESRGDKYIVGIGINKSVVDFPKELEGIAGGLGELDAASLIDDILDELDEKIDFQEIESEYNRRLR